MESTNIIRKVDELGRIVLPKEVRNRLKIKTDDLLEIVIDEDRLYLKKYSVIRNFKRFAQDLTDMLYKYTKKDILIADKECIIAYSGNKKNHYLGKDISDKIFDSIKRRESIMQNHVKELKLVEDDEIKCSYVMDTIICNSEYIGIIVMYSEEKILNEHDMNAIKILSSFLNKYLED